MGRAWPIWYWETRNLNRSADQNDIETITRIWNGGKNGLSDRIDYYGRLALVVCGYGVSVDEVRRFQVEHRLDVDGDVGPKTRAALHTRMVALDGSASDTVRSSPVVEEKIVEKAVAVEVEKQVVPTAVEKEVKQKSSWLSGLFGGGFSLAGFWTWLSGGIDKETLLIILAAGAVGAAVFLVGGEWIARRVKSIRREIEA
jgi:putative chitinase